MRVCVFGAGAIGGWLAGWLAEAGTDVSVIARGAHLRAIQKDGLVVEGAGRRVVARPRASDDAAELGVQDAVIVTVKAPSLPSVAAGLAPLLGPETPVAFLTNGVPWWYFHGHGGPLDGKRLELLDPGDALWNAVGMDRLVGGIAWPATSVPAPGVVRLLGGISHGIMLGTPDGRESVGVEALAEACRTAGVTTTVAPQIRDLIWEKLAFNLSAGPMCVLTQAPVRDTYAEAAAVAASRRVMAETIALIAAMGRNAAVDVERIVAANTVLGHRPSILQDLMAGRSMEIDVLYTVPLELARLCGVAMPTLELLVALIKARARAAGLYA